jgi:hypothetical protein
METGMRFPLLVLACAVLATGCGPTVQQQRAARLEAFRLELDSALAQWKSDVGQRRFPTSAEAARGLAARYELVYDRWGVPPDALAQAALAYAVALATRVDRGDLSTDEANALLARMDADMGSARSALRAGRIYRAAGRDAAMRLWWRDYWASHERFFGAADRDPVRCDTPPAETARGPIKCY